MVRSTTMAARYDADAPVVAVYGAVRGLGLLSSASGIVIAPERCQQVIRKLLLTSTVDKRSDDILLGAAAGMAADVKGPRMERGLNSELNAEAERNPSEHGIPATFLDQRSSYAVQGLHKLKQVQDKALELYRTKTPQLPSGLDVLMLQPFSESGMTSEGRLVDFLIGQFDVNFTPPVKRRMRELGGQFERLYNMRSRGEIPEFEWQTVRIVVQNAPLWPLRQFKVPNDLLAIMVGPPELGQEALDKHARENSARRPAGWEKTQGPAFNARRF